MIWKFFIAALLAIGSAQAAPPQVAVEGGLVAGHERDGALLFHGIPFAAPPLGELRWRAPQPVVPWRALRDASTMRPACLQNDYKWNRANYLFASEDCLTLDVRTQSVAGKRPVMVWIHGGSNRAGSGDGPVWSTMSAQGVVLVSVQYRLGIFGFLSHRKLTEEQNGASGNYGLMDQIAALRWVKANIAHFGGDSSNVTIYGESAGSQDVSLLLAAPAARGLFHKAIMQSGTPGFGMSFRTHADAVKIGDQLDGLTDSGGDLTRLRRTSAHALLAADLKLNEAALWNPDFLWLRTTIDGAVMTKSPRDLLAEAPGLPVIIGNNRFEFGPPPGSVDIATYARHWLGAKADAAVALYRAEDRKGADPRLGPIEARMETDFVFRCPANTLANLLADQGWPVWRYEFDVGPDDGTVGDALTSHAYEISFIMDRKAVGPATKPVQMQDYWVGFAKSGKPGKTWPGYDSKVQNYVLFDRKGLMPKQKLRAEVCALTRAL